MLSLAVIALLAAQWEPPETAPDLVARGVALRREGRNEEALALFERAYELDPTPRASAQIALAEQALGRWIDAERHLLRALEQRQDTWIARNASLLAGALGTIQGRLGWLEVRSNVAGAELWIDGTLTSTLPAARPARIVAGVSVVELRAGGHEPVRRRIDVAPGTTAREMMRMVPTLELRAVSSATTGLGRGGAAPTARGPPDAGARTASATTRLGWVAAGVAALGFATAVPAHVVYERAAREFNACAPTLGASRRELCGDAYDRATLADGFKWGGYLAGGLGGVAALVLLVALPEGEGPLACAPASGGGAVRCLARF